MVVDTFWKGEEEVVVGLIICGRRQVANCIAYREGPSKVSVII